MKHCTLVLLACAPTALAQCQPQWSGLGEGCSWDVHAMDPDPYLLAGASRLLVAGYFYGAGSGEARCLASWDGRQWSTPLGQIDDNQGLVDDAIVLLPQSSPARGGYYIGGEFSSVAGTPALSAARWDGKTWSALGTGPGAAFTNCIAPYTEAITQRELLYLGGGFAMYQGLPANSLLRWDGVQWSPLSPTLNKPNSSPTARPEVYALETYDDDGPLGKRPPGLYVGGWHKGAGAVESYNVIRWDGAQWEGLGPGVADTVYSLGVFDDDGPGPRPEALFVSGTFNRAGGILMNGFARWDGHEWTAPPLFGGNARDMLVWDRDGAGAEPPMLYATGFFAGAIKRWRGQGFGWEPLPGGGLAQGVGATYGLSLAVWDEDGPGPNPGGLYVGGNFTMAGAVPASHIARWGCPLPPGGPCYADCNQDGALNLSDFGCFQTKFVLGLVSGDPYADCNGDGVLNFADFGCFTTKFALGCP